MEIRLVPIPYSLKIVIKKFHEVYPGYPETTIAQLFFDLFTYSGHIERNKHDEKESLDYLFKMTEIYLVELNLDSDEYFCYYFMEKHGIETLDSFFESEAFQEATEANSLLISLLTEYAIRNVYQGEGLWLDYQPDDNIDYVVLEDFNLMQNIAKLAIYMESESTTYQF